MLEADKILIRGNKFVRKIDPHNQTHLVYLLLIVSFPVPVPTYILGPSSEDRASNYPDMKGCELCENVIYLGKKFFPVLTHV